MPKTNLEIIAIVSQLTYNSLSMAEAAYLFTSTKIPIPEPHEERSDCTLTVCAALEIYAIQHILKSQLLTPCVVTTPLFLSVSNGQRVRGGVSTS